IYNYFGSKEELLREVFRNYFDQAIRDFEQYMSEGHSLKEKIEHIIFLEKESYNDFPPGLIKELLIDDEELSRYMEEQYRNKAI
ncbi:TetR/AcrR family transcriptional regulator, partial [Salmonella enterica subsp. enterica serovar Oslo]